MVSRKEHDRSRSEECEKTENLYSRNDYKGRLEVRVDQEVATSHGSRDMLILRVIRHCPVGHPRDEITPTLGVRAPTLGVGTPNLRGTCPYFRVTTC